MMHEAYAVEYIDANGWVHSIVVHSRRLAIDAMFDLRVQGHSPVIIRCEYRRKTQLQEGDFQ